MRSRTWSSALLVLAVALGGCGGNGAPRSDAQIRTGDGFHGAGVIYNDVPPGTPYTVGDLVLCLSRPGAATIDHIDSLEPFGQLRLDDFTVIPNEMERGEPGFDDSNVPIVDYKPALKRSLTLRGTCPPEDASPTMAPPQSVALILQYSKVTDQSAGNKGIVIDYTSGGHKHELTIDWEILLCAPGDTATPRCASSGG